MKIPDLSKIDIKDIDINKIKNLLMERKELALQIAFGIVAFFMVVSILGGSQKEIKKYKTQINAMQSKFSVIGLYKKSQSDIDAYLKNIPPPMSEGQIISFVTDMADKNHVRIQTFTPDPNPADGKKFFREVSIQFSLQADQYKRVVGLISDIEHAKSALQVKSCLIQNATPTDQQGDGGLLNFIIEVASLEVKK